MKRTLTQERYSQAVDATASAFDIERVALVSRRRGRAVAAARLALYAALYDGCLTTYEEIGAFTNRDHTTVIWGVARARSIAAVDPGYAAAVAQIAQAVT
jgi:chromosomal replication initiation ATPase DnaA